MTRVFLRRRAPFILEADSPGGLLPVGTLIGLNVVLLGRAIELLPYVIHALQQAGYHGLGKQRARLCLQCVLQEDLTEGGDWRSIFEGETGQLSPYTVAPIVSPPRPPSVRLELFTPVRIKHRGQYLNPETFTFWHLLANLLRRFQTLEQFYGEGKTDMERLPCELEDLAPLIQALEWQDWSRWSSRQKSTMKLGGVVGHLEVETESFLPLWPLLWLGQWLHVGNAASFGLGQYRIKIL